MTDDEVNTTATPMAATNPPVDDLPVTAPADSLPDPVSASAPETDVAPEGSPLNDGQVVKGVDPVELAPAPAIYSEVAEKISDSHNVLIALSSDPSVDEMSAAIGLSLYLDKLGKRATAIYSGATPNALEFLKPEETFAPTADTLQDFVIAINKEKADHLRYKIDGDYVKIFITPYRTRIAEEDLDFSYGDFNVDLVLALNVANGIDLDAALREHGRIMHDAVVVNVTTGNPGKFGEIEWSDKTSSAVSEMISKLIYSAKSEIEIGKDEATAFLTGIVAATNRFSNAKTTPETMKIASLLMESGANQQLISKNITPEVENELHTISRSGKKKTSEAEGDNSSLSTEEKVVDPTSLEIIHGENGKAEETKKDESEEETKETNPRTEKSEISEKEGEEDEKIEVEKPEPDEKPGVVLKPGVELKPDSEKKVEEKPVDEKSTEEKIPEEKSVAEPGDNALLDDLKAAEASLSMAGAETTPDISNRPVRVEDADAVLPEVQEPTASTSAPTIQTTNTDTFTVPTPSVEPATVGVNESEKVIQPTADLSTEVSNDGTNKYGKMLEDALNGINASTNVADTATATNPATMNTPSVASTPEINGVPEINYAPPVDAEILPPPPAPPVNMGAPTAVTAEGVPFTPSMPSDSTSSGEVNAPGAVGTENTAAPVVSESVSTHNDPGAFKIPEM